jgi:hypothetical protein
LVACVEENIKYKDFAASMKRRTLKLVPNAATEFFPGLLSRSLVGVLHNKEAKKRKNHWRTYRKFDFEDF